MFADMTTIITMDRAGRLVIPQPIRERFGLLGGAHTFEIEAGVDGIVLRPIGDAVPMERHASGWIVFNSSGSTAVDPVRAVTQVRERRQRDITGPSAKQPRRGG